MPAQSRHSMLAWRKSSVSQGQGNCVEVASGESSVMVRDSRDRSGVMLSFDPEQWTGFLGSLR